MKPVGIPEKQDWRQRRAPFFSQTLCRGSRDRQRALHASVRDGSGLAVCPTPLLIQAQKYQTEPCGDLQKCNRSNKILARY